MRGRLYTKTDYAKLKGKKPPQISRYINKGKMIDGELLKLKTERDEIHGKDVVVDCEFNDKFFE